MELNEKILKAIQDDLPSATAGELKKFIDDANVTKEKLISQTKQMEGLNRDLTDLNRRRNTYETAEKLSQEAEIKLKQVIEREGQLKYDIQAEQIKQRDFVINKFEGFLNNLVKNPRAIELISESTSYNHSTHYDGSHSSQYKTGEFKSGSNEKTETKD